jgi:hypothetical protein
MTEPLRVAPEAEDADDNLSRAGAAELAQRLRDYWHARRSTTFKAWVEPSVRGSNRSGRAVYSVRSNLVRGTPPPEPPR